MKKIRSLTGKDSNNEAPAGSMQKFSDRIYDLIIVGAGPAGLTAAIYASRYMLDYIVLGKIFGGAISQAHKVCNFPTQNNISGFELTQKLVQHVNDLKGEIHQEEVKKIEKSGRIFVINTGENIYKTKNIILALGRKRKKLDVPGEKELLGKGVSYCATCDAPFFKEKTVAVIGGSNSALTAALLLAEHANRVYIIYRQGKFFRAEPAWIKQVEENKKIRVIFDSEVKEILGKEKVEKIIIENRRKGLAKTINTDGVFIEIGFIPDNRLAEQLGLQTSNGYISVDKSQRTSHQGIYAAGDMTDNILKQVITACSEGAVAASSVYQDIKIGRPAMS